MKCYIDNDPIPNSLKLAIAIVTGGGCVIMAAVLILVATGVL